MPGKLTGNWDLERIKYIISVAKSPAAQKAAHPISKTETRLDVHPLEDQS